MGRCDSVPAPRPHEPVAEFRARLRSWLDVNVDLARRPAWTDDDRRQTTAGLFNAGFLGVTWPPDYGGRGLSARYQTVVNEELAPYAWATRNTLVTVGICAPVLARFGTEEQRARHLPRMLRGDELWTQLLSEPGAGSDLASVSTTADRERDTFIVNGQKVWTSSAADADFGLALVRTRRSERYHAGLSMLSVDLSSPGIDIRPLRQMTGDATFNEVFIDDVVVPVTGLVGAEGEGWAVLTAMLKHERIALGAGTTGRRMDSDAFPELLAAAREHGMLENSQVREALVEVYLQQRLLDQTGIRIREAVETGQEIGPVGSIAKVGTARAARCAAETAMLIAGSSGTGWRDEDGFGRRAAEMLLHFPMTSIAGGTTEIQKNIIAERILGLPRERRP